jgi:hypothetical protein
MINNYIYYKRVYLLLLLLITLGTDLYAQESPVSGIVTDQDGPVPGVNILLKGTTRGTVTDLNGNYTISTPSDATLIFSSIGYTAQEIPVGGRSNINVNLIQDIRSLSEVVVTG